MGDRHERPQKRRRQWGARQNCLGTLILAEASCQAGLPGTYYFEFSEFSVTPHVAAYPSSQNAAQ